MTVIPEIKIGQMYLFRSTAGKHMQDAVDCASITNQAQLVGQGSPPLLPIGSAPISVCEVVFFAQCSLLTLLAEIGPQ